MWALEKSIFDRIQAARSRGEVATQAGVLEVGAFVGWSVDDIYSVAGGHGVIKIEGVLTRSRDLMAAIFGGGNTTYAAIVDAISAADADENVKEITLAINSPGGHFSGLFDVIEMLNATDKPTTARVEPLAASAAYAIAASADKIEMAGRAAEVGSIGTVIEMRVQEEVVSVTNTESPDKRPDLTTEQGRATVREYLDDAFALFAGVIAEGRGVSVKTVSEEYGKGRMFFATEAEKRGMVDTVLDTVQNTANVSASSRENETKTIESDKGTPMDLIKLKTEHRELHASIVESTLATERDRVSAHLHMGQESGDMKTAVSAIKEGSGMTAELTAKYVTATARKAQTQARIDDNVDGVEDDDDSADKDAKAAQSLQDRIAARLNVEVK